MAPRLLLDSDILIHLQRGHKGIRDRFSDTSVETMATSAISCGELYVGALRLGFSKKRLALLNAMFTILPVLPFDAEASMHFARIKAAMWKRGALVADLDMQIAAIALSRNLTVITQNIRDFSRIPDLRVECWDE